MASDPRYLCSICCNLGPSDPCALCSNTARNQRRICVVQLPADVETIERTGSYNGLYHVLDGALAPLDGIGPTSLHIAELLARLGKYARARPAIEVILATRKSREGIATRAYLLQLLSFLGIPLTVRELPWEGKHHPVVTQMVPGLQPWPVRVPPLAIIAAARRRSGSTSHLDGHGGMVE